MFHHLFRSPPIPLSFDLAALLSRRSIYALAKTLKSFYISTFDTHLCPYGLPGSQIPFDTHTFVPQRQFTLEGCLRPCCSLSYRRINPLLDKYHPPRINSSLTICLTLPHCLVDVKLRFEKPSTYPLRQITMNNTRPRRFTATAGTDISRGCFTS